MEDAHPITVAYADHAAVTGGAEISLKLLLERLDRRHFRPLLLHSPNAEWLDETLFQDGTVRGEVFRDDRLLAPRRQHVRPGLLGNLKSLVLAARPVLEMRGLLHQYRAALLHSNTLKCHLLAGAAAKTCGIPVIWHMRDIVKETGPRAMLRRAAGVIRPVIIAISQAVANEVRDLSQRVEVVYNGVPLRDFCPGPEPPGLREQLGLAPRHRVVMIVARLTPWKGHMQLLRAMPAVVERFEDVRLVIVGSINFSDEEYGQELRSMAEAEGVAQAIVWAGHRDDIPALLRVCDVFVLPSKNEPFGRAIVEAMASGKPVVAGRSGAAPEVCPDGVCGYLVDEDNPADIAQAIISLLADPRRACEMGRAGRERAVTLFDADANAQRMQKIYRELLD
jgi:glycosyltransferase involved in cell wall biosynthesis